MKKMILLFVVLLGVEPLSAQINSYFSPGLHGKSSASQNFLSWHANKRSPIESFNFSLYDRGNSNIHRNIFENRPTNFYRLYSSTDLNTSTENDNRTSIWVEMGYVLAMETVFTGMSYLSSRDQRYGPVIAGGFDLFMGLAGLPNASRKESAIQKTGYYLISAGFIAKSLYNFRFGESHSKKTRFLTNFIGFNVLVFTGYFLDTLN